MNPKMEPCPQCRDFVMLPEWGSVMEFAGNYTEQTCSIQCQGCSFSISIAVHPEKLKPGQVQVIETTLKSTWNALSKQFARDRIECGE